MIHTLTQHVEIFTRHFLPSGPSFGAKNVIGSNLRKLVEGMCNEFVRSERSINEFIEEMMPDTTEDYIGRWEQAVGIPDSCFPVEIELEARRLNVQRKLSLLGLQTEADFVSFASSLGLTIKAKSGIDHDVTNGYGTESPDITFTNAKEARFTIVITSLFSTNAFDYDFDFPFQTAEQALMECVFRHAKPANCDIVYTTE